MHEQKLQELLCTRSKKLEELAAIEESISKVYAAHIPIAHPAIFLSPIVGSGEEQPVSTIAKPATATSKKGRPQKKEGFSQEQSLPFLIIDFLKDKKSGESLSAIVGFCLKAGYESSSSNFKRVVEQTLYSMKVKQVIFRDELTRRFVLC